ncbi:hypothetical protein HBO23_15235 [Pseudomonas sp. WS 5532]|uniref:hypothetical protein n=1 Tax=Pseudomonas TaxID=286 RepID=UPI0014728E87|nr:MULTISPECIES: hypothetical protein [Pseudomonas]MCF5143354.1 hypothetical protein [Pseudomonas sp. PA-6-3C]MCF5147313.1 hypothetical protein [Pseudomonas sp. PA-6-3F]MCF5158420.1 hypothetical protein [Pseudomonas sp. PA-6-2E]MCF5176916.1 hypothetical protein [Pseudomonas sp. PA-6-1D]MCF5194789.1 hypothetical protein [Pseudomonas sp. PA-6-1H]
MPDYTEQQLLDLPKEKLINLTSQQLKKRDELLREQRERETNPVDWSTMDEVITVSQKYAKEIEEMYQSDEDLNFSENLDLPAKQ